ARPSNSSEARVRTISRKSASLISGENPWAPAVVAGAAESAASAAGRSPPQATSTSAAARLAGRRSRCIADDLRGTKPPILAADGTAGRRRPVGRGSGPTGGGPPGQSRGARAVEYGIAVAPLTVPVRAVSCTYSLTSRSNSRLPSTTALGPTTIRGGVRSPKLIQLTPEDLRTRRLPCTCESMPTVTSPETVSTSPV